LIRNSSEEILRLPSPSLGLLLLVLLPHSFSAAQQKPGAPSSAPPTAIVSPEVRPDNTVTFRFRDPNAKEVKLALEGAAEAQLMQKDEQGVWSLTTSPLASDYYSYSFLADGVHLIDPSNPLLTPNLRSTSSAVHVPGPSSLPWEVNDVPRGEIHRHFYESAVAQDNRDYYVYTPPTYDPSQTKTYPVLYLLHGYSDDASGWTAVGHANVILDNLMAQGKAKPMIVVMPLGYGTLDFVLTSEDVWNQAEPRDRNFKEFTEELLTEVMPRVESEYRITKDRNARAIAGLSMGGSESLLTGLNNLDKFSWIGAFSSGGLPEDFRKDFPSLDAKANQQLHLLWIACGTEDHLISLNRNLREWLTGKGIKHADLETPGMHTWMVWRRNLIEFSQLLFR
jgi:enterochelin esterase-like enzyme